MTGRPEIRALLENLHLAAVLLDPKGEIRFCNSCLLSLTGWTCQELIGHSLSEFVAGGAFPAGESVIRTRTGKPRRIQWNSVTLDDPAEESDVVLVGVDVTEYRALQEQQRQAQKLESLGRLASGVAHDFNNLLTVMNGYADMALKRLAPDDAVRTMVEQIRKAGGQAARLAGQLLAAGRKETGPPKAIDVNQTVEDAAAMLRPTMGASIEMVLRLGAGVGRIAGDAAQMTRVLMNLAVNARDAMPAGGRLTIETARSESGEAPVPALPPGGYVVITVADTGVGMDAYVREHLFEPFFTTKPEGCGTGLGLATVQNIVRQYGGGIAVDSAPGGGAAFRIFLPRAGES